MAVEEAPLPLLTTEAVLTELFHFLVGEPSRVSVAWRVLRSGWIEIASLGPASQPEIERLMLRYGDRPMDYADATLVHLAERERLSMILTIDHDDFETYRIGGRARFLIRPARTG